MEESWSEYSCTGVDITHLAPLYSGAKLKYRKGWTLALGQQVRRGRQGNRGLVVHLLYRQQIR